MFEERKHIHRRLVNPRKKKLKQSSNNNNNNNTTVNVMSHSNNDNNIRRSRAESSSDFSLDLMPVDKIVKRSLHAWSVHHSLTTSNWIATISRPVENSPNSKTRHAQFVFNTEREARKFCQAYAPPKYADQPFCQGCRQQGSFRHCRNCGVNLCDACSTKWGLRMIPKTYLLYPTTWVRVCRACDWLSNAFCMALLQGRYEDALRIHSTVRSFGKYSFRIPVFFFWHANEPKCPVFTVQGNVNLRTSFADIRGEACFPIHCAVIGGSLELVKWMVEGSDASHAVCTRSTTVLVGTGDDTAIPETFDSCASWTRYCTPANNKTR